MDFADWLRRVERSPHASRMIVRGSLVTRRFFPKRVCEDVDHLVQDVKKASELDAIADDIAGPLITSRKTIWADTDFPGLRLELGELQVDLGFGDPLSLPPERVEIEGAMVLAARPESMIAWKMHGLVELGPRGRWRPKDLYDAYLYASLDLDRDLVREAVRVAFASRGHSTELMRPMFEDSTWGASSGSRKRWKRFRKTVTHAPDLPDVIAKVRGRWARVVV